MKTIKLDSPRATPERTSDILTGALWITVLLGIGLLLRPVTPAPLVPTIVQPTLQSVIVIRRETAVIYPTATPAPTSAPAVVYITLPTPPPEVVYIESAPVTAQEAPAAPQVVDAAPTLAPQQMVILDRQQWAEQAATERAGR